MLTESNYAISYTADKNFVEHTLRPIATLMEQEANIQLFGARARGTVYSRMNLRALMRGDPKVRGEWYKAMVNAGVMSINEVRELEELNAIGPEGDEHYLQTSMTTLGRIADGSNVAQPAPAGAGRDADRPGRAPGARRRRGDGRGRARAQAAPGPRDRERRPSRGDNHHRAAPQVGAQVDNHAHPGAVGGSEASRRRVQVPRLVTVENNVASRR
jgi:hypothetical protein